MLNGRCLLCNPLRTTHGAARVAVRGVVKHPEVISLLEDDDEKIKIEENCSFNTMELPLAHEEEQEASMCTVANDLLLLSRQNSSISGEPNLPGPFNVVKEQEHCDSASSGTHMASIASESAHSGEADTSEVPKSDAAALKLLSKSKIQIEEIFALMRKYDSHLHVQTKALCTLEARLYGRKKQACSSGEVSEDRILEIIDTTDGITAIISAMQNHDDSELQRAACSVLWKIATHNPNLTDAAIGAVLGTLRKYFRIPMIAECACGVFANFQNQTAHASFQEGQGLDAIITVVHFHGKKRRIMSIAIEILREIARQSKECSEKIISGGCVGIVIDAMKREKRESLLAEDGCGLLLNLSYWSTEACETIEKTGINTIINMLRKNRGTPAFVEHACKLLNNLFPRPATKSVQNKAIEAIVSALKSHPENEQVQDAACHVLNRLCRK